MASQEVRESAALVMAHLTRSCRTEAFSEMVPVLHVVGVPSTSQQKSKPMLHHTLGDGR